MCVDDRNRIMEYELEKKKTFVHVYLQYEHTEQIMLGLPCITWPDIFIMLSEITLLLELVREMGMMK